MKRLIVFDLDGTLAESKSPLDAEMGALLIRLLGIVKVAIISGGAWPQFKAQLLPHLGTGDLLRNLSLLPTCGTRFYRYDGAWAQSYAEDIAPDDRRTIVRAVTLALDRAGLRPDRHWGELIEDRGSQITLSALGQQAPLAEKAAWDPDFAKRRQIVSILAPMIPDFSIQMGGATSIDITRKGIDKAYGIGKLHDLLGIAITDMIFVGDALFPGGNDFPAKRTGVLTIAVRDTEETKRVIEAIAGCLESVDQA